MKTFPIVVPCHFGLEAVLKREIIDLGYDIERVEDGRMRKHFAEPMFFLERLSA